MPSNEPHLIRRIARLLSGRGKPRPSSLWQEQYGAGQWERLKQIEELGHYSVIVGYLGFLKPGGAFLDVGCGEGILQARLGAEAYSRYVGVDFSATAIERAASRSDDRTVFVQAEADGFTTPEKFDAVVFNEVLYYCDDPVRTLARYEPNLEDGGVYVVSMIASRRSFFIWRGIEGRYDTVDETTVGSRSGRRWRCAVLRPRG